MPPTLLLEHPVAAPLVVVTLTFVGALVVTRGRPGAALSDLVVASALASAPAATWAALAALRPATPEAHLLALFATLVTTVGVLSTLAPRPPRLRAAPSPVASPEILARVRVLASRLGVRSPDVHVARTTGSSMTVNASVQGLAIPVLSVADGVLHRLAPAERDAILAHELGHLATRTGWKLVGLAAVSLSLAVAATQALGLRSSNLGLALAFVLMVVGWRLVGRRLEVASDLLAARAVGHAAMASALEATHAVGLQPKDGILAVLVDATSTHPSLALRREALRDDAPSAERELIPVDARACLRDRRAARAALAVAVACALLLAIPTWTDAGGPALAASVALMLVGALPVILQLAASWRNVRYFARRPGTWTPGLVRVALAVLVTLGCLLAADSRTMARLAGAGPDAAPGWSLGVLGLACVAAGIALSGAILMLRHQRLRRIVAAALADGRAAEVLALAASKARAFRRDPILAYGVPVAEALSGHRDDALESLARLSRSGRLPGLPEDLMARIHLDADPERALELATRAEALMPLEAMPLRTLARALRRLGRREEAESVAARGLALQPSDGLLHAVAIGCAVDRGDLATARRRLEAARALAPGDAQVLVAAAELAVEDGSVDAARQVIADADRALAAQAWVVSRRELDRAKARLAEREARAVEG